MRTLAPAYYSRNASPTFIKAVEMLLQELKLQHFPCFHLLVAIDANDQFPKFGVDVGDRFITEMFGNTQPALPEPMRAKLDMFGPHANC